MQRRWSTVRFDMPLRRVVYEAIHLNPPPAVAARYRDYRRRPTDSTFSNRATPSQLMISLLTAEGRGVEVRKGDCVIVRTGMLETRRGQWGDYNGGPAPGLFATYRAVAVRA